MTKSKKTLVPCECSKYEILVNVRENGTNGDLIWDQEIRTGCPGVLTGRTFAPGHDAKLKGYLIRAGLAGYEVTRVEEGMAYSSNAAAAADRYGFGAMVREGIELGREKRDAKIENKKARAKKADARNEAELEKLPEIAEADKPVAEEDAQPSEPAIVKAKVGRWTYEGVVDGDGENFSFTYTDNKGETKTATKFTLV